jgi:hypothetical protein
VQATTNANPYLAHFSAVADQRLLWIVGSRDSISGQKQRLKLSSHAPAALLPAQL